MANHHYTDASIDARQPVFPDGLPLMRPRVPAAEELAPYLEEMQASGYMSNFGPIGRRYEETLAEMLQVKHCLAIANLSTGLMYLPQVIGLDGGEVILPSYTFVATAHSLKLGGLSPVFADIDPETFCLDPASVEAAIGPDTVAICGVHLYGTPCDVVALEEIAQKRGLALFFDSAHGIGSTVQGRPVGGFGLAEGFSTSVTKIYTTMGEGGFVATNDDTIAERLHMSRNWGRSKGDDSSFPSIVSKLPEVSAAAGLIELPRVPGYVATRQRLMQRAETLLSDIDGISFPKIRDGDTSGHKDFAIMVDGEAFGMNRDDLASALAAEGVETRSYFAPAIHQMEAYRDINHRVPLVVTEKASTQALCLPLFNQMTEDDVAILCETIANIQLSTNSS